MPRSRLGEGGEESYAIRRTKVRCAGERISLGRNEARKKGWEFLWVCQAEKIDWSRDNICLGTSSSCIAGGSFGGEY